MIKHTASDNNDPKYAVDCKRNDIVDMELNMNELYYSFRNGSVLIGTKPLKLIVRLKPLR